MTRLERGQRPRGFADFVADLVTAANRNRCSGKRMERLWKNEGQRDANGSIVSCPETASTSQISLPPAATGCPKVAW